MNTGEKLELSENESEFQKKVLEFLVNGYEQFANKRLYPDCVFTASKIIEINGVKAYYLHIEAHPPKYRFHDYTFRAIAQFRRSIEGGETFNVQLLDVVDYLQVEKFFTQIWMLMGCGVYHDG
ncbi:hypothetical protein [Aulosira sp. FACHB-615]|uniref:hypothetical protein n=1 Tax=Aulosira sp. FACHB-615 TaxID=2692777 RepID=UPI0016886BC3|nr:hypothetical protein [Aulosira sp. FACHB-615]MBD2492489.1 hypothetical protein [Aulosira sp. FACHB-615]